jgi:type II secretion system protein J
VSGKRQNFLSKPRMYMRGSAGFTLLELVVAMSMVAVLAVSLSESMHVAFSAVKSADAAIDPPRTASVAMDFVSQDLQNALPPGTQLAGNFEATQGQDSRGHENDDLVFFSSADSPQHVDGNGDIKQIELTMEQTPDGDWVLVRRVIRNLLSETQVNPDEEILCRGVNSFTLEYSTGSQWQQTWDSTQEDNTIPAAVQVTLELQRPDTKGVMQTMRYTRVFALSCSTASTDSTVNTGVSLP